MPRPAEPRWLLLMHQIPPSPSYLRVKVSRRLQDLGAVAVKNSVYVLPRSAQALEDFQWVRREIVTGGGDASVCEARFLEGLTDDAVEALFNTARAADYAALVQESRRLQGRLTRAGRRPPRLEAKIAASLLRLRKRLADVSALDFFSANGRDTVLGLLAAVEAGLRPPADPGQTAAMSAREVRGRTWVTRADVHVDRIASAWLIRRFIDRKARFKFVRGQAYRARPTELLFDMTEADFTHQGDLCTFEVLLRRFSLAEAALKQVGEIVHDIDLKDAKFARPEALGIDRLLAGMILRERQDEARLREGGAVFESLHEYFKKKR